jgi:hypothetical protein
MRSLFVLALAGTVAAQTCVHSPDNNAGAGGCNVIPFGQVANSTTWSNQKYQQVVPASTLGNNPLVIRELAFAACGSGARTFQSIKITVDQTTNSPLSTTFAANLGPAAIVVLDSTDFVWQNTANAWNRIGLARSFVYIPARGDVVIDVEIRGAAFAGTHGFRSAAVQRVYAFGWTGSPPATGSTDNLAALKVELCTDLADVQAYGSGCRGQQSNIPTIGGSPQPRVNTPGFAITLAGAAPTRPTFLGLGGQALPPFPIDLGSIGLPGCRLYCSLDLMAPGVTDPSGNRTFPLAIPNDPGLVGARVFAQHFVLDAPGSLQVSDYLRILIGT